MVEGPRAGDGVLFLLPGPGVGVRVPMPFSVAILYLRILALDMREVKWKTDTMGSSGADIM